MKDIIKCLKQGGVLFIFLCISLILNHRFGYITLIGIFCILTFVLVSIKTKIEKGDIVILSYLIFYTLFSYINGVSYSLSTLVLYAFAPFFFYQYGKKIPQIYNNEKGIINTWLIIILCYCIDIFIITITNYLETGELFNENRLFFFSESDDSLLNATLVGLPMGIGMIGLPMYFITKNKILKFLFLSLSLLSIITTLSLLNRTGLVVLSICFLVVIGYKYRRNITMLLFVFLIVVIAITVLMNTGVISLELIEAYEERNINISTAGDRTTRWMEAIIKVFTNPLGWTDGKTYYVHNMWLDIARISGIIPFLLLLYMAYDCFKKAFQIIRRFNNSFSYMLLGLNVCFFLTCFVEPIYGGTHFMLYCMLWGTERELFINKCLLS